MHERLAHLAERDLALRDEHAQTMPGAHRVGGGGGATVLPVEAQMTALAPSSLAAVIAMVMPRSLKDPVGLAPSTLRWTSQPVRSESTCAGTSGVPPSRSVTTGVAAATGSRSRYSSMMPRHGVRHADFEPRLHGDGHYSPSTRMMLATPRTVSSLRSASTVPARAASRRAVGDDDELGIGLAVRAACWRTVSIDTPCSAKTVPPGRAHRLCRPRRG